MEAENQLPYGKGVVNVAYVADSIKLPGSGCKCPETSP